MRTWTVGGALIRHADGLVLVGNRRRDQSLEWTPPGGVIDTGESVQQGLAREVREETGLVVVEWVQLRYRVSVEAPDMGWLLTVEAWEATVEGTVRIDDPDGIVEEVRHVGAAGAAPLLATAPPWVHHPVGQWLTGVDDGEYGFVLRGLDRGTATVERVR